MATILRIQYNNVIATVDKVEVEDITGAYNVSTNPGGYGVPNLVRANILLILVANYIDIPTAGLVVVPNTTDATTNTKWTITLPDDGVIESLLFVATAHNSASSYSVDNVVAVMENSYPKAYKALKAVPADIAITNTEYWSVINTVADYPIASATEGNYDTDNYLHYKYSQACIGKDMKTLLLKGWQCMDCHNLSNVEKAWWYYEAAILAFPRGELVNANKLIRGSSELCNCNCGC